MNPRSRMYRQTAVVYRAPYGVGDRGGNVQGDEVAVFGDPTPIRCLLLPDPPNPEDFAGGTAQVERFVMECDVMDIRVGDIVRSPSYPNTSIRIERFMKTPDTGFKITAFICLWGTATRPPNTGPS